MSRKAKTLAPPTHKILMEAEVARQIRQHSRSSMKTEVCGILIGREEGPLTIVEACIAGANAAQGGAHVTFTQDTWEHVYQVKDAKYPNERIVGWYHSHPGFGVFLSDHDLFIHENFFSSPQQIAWVYDPHNDEEGCFAWHEGKIEKIDDVAFRYGQACNDSVDIDTDEETVVVKVREKWWDEWKPLVRECTIGVLFLLLGAGAMYYYIGTRALLFPRGEHAIVIIDGDRIGVVPPEIAAEFLGLIQRDMQLRSDPNLPQARPGTSAAGEGGTAVTPQGGQDGRQK